MTNKIIIPDECLIANPKYNKAKQKCVVSSWLIQLNYPIQRSLTFRIRVPEFGTVGTHGNKKDAKEKFNEKNNKRLWKEQKKIIELSEKKLLF